QPHWPDRTRPGPRGRFDPRPDAAGSVPIDETLEALAGFVADGRIRHIGAANESPWGAMRWLQAADRDDRPRIASNQNGYSLLNRWFETGLAEIAVREDVGLIAYSPLSGGYLTGKYLD